MGIENYLHLIYITIFVLAGIFFYRWHKRKLEASRSEIKSNHIQKEKKSNSIEMARLQKKIEELEQWKLQLENTNKGLKKDVKKKSVELAKKAKENKNNNQILQKIKERLEEIEKDPTLITKMKLKGIRRLLEQYLEIEDNTFEIQIEEIHQEFFQLLKKEFPDLTTYDLRLSVYLKMGLNTREIAEIVNVLPSSINVSRSRLRKKLNLEAGEDLFEFMNQLEAEKLEA